MKRIKFGVGLGLGVAAVVMMALMLGSPVSAPVFPVMGDAVPSVLAVGVTIPVTDIVIGGVTPAPFAATAAGNQFLNDGKTFFYVQNASATIITITPTVTYAAFGLTMTGPSVSFPASTTKLVGPFPPGAYNDAMGYVSFNYSQVLTIWVAAFRIP
jgi:hypothetical protein